MRHDFDRTVASVAQGLKAGPVEVSDLFARCDLGPRAVVPAQPGGTSASNPASAALTSFELGTAADADGRT